VKLQVLNSFQDRRTHGGPVKNDDGFVRLTVELRFEQLAQRGILLPACEPIPFLELAQRDLFVELDLDGDTPGLINLGLSLRLDEKRGSRHRAGEGRPRHIPG
jgi:hypothetical protein